MQKSLKIKFIFFSILFTFLIFFLFRNLQLERQADEKLIEHTNSVLLETKKFFKSIKDSESSQRGYLLTENLNYLGPYKLSKKATYDCFENLKIMVSNDTKQLELLDDIKMNLDLKYAEMDQTISITKKGKKDLAMIIVQSDYGETYMETMNKLIDKFLESEYKLLDLRKQKFNFNNLINNYLFQIVLVFSLISLLYFYYKNSSRKLNLIELNNELENKVNKRTLELIKLNKNLEKRVSIEVEENRKKDLVLLDQAKRVSLGEMMGNIAHQWRQPLNAISVTTSSMQLRNNLNMLTKEDFDNSISTIMENSKYLSSVIDTFRNFVKDNKEFRNISTENEIINSIKILNSTLEHDFIKLIDKINYSSKTKFYGYQNQLSEVIIIILNNAKDVLSERKIENKTIYLEKDDFDDKTIISISDNAGGIKEDIIDRIFEPYFTTKHKSVGTGLGLYICKKIIEDDLHGRFYVENTTSGAKFFIEIPLVKKEI